MDDAVLTDRQRMAELSFGYLTIMSAVAGYICQRGPDPDMDTVDAMVRAGGRRHPLFDVQLKATARPVWRADGLHFRLNAKNYSDLVDERSVKLVLVVLVLPSDPIDWVDFTGEGLVLHGIALWDWLEGSAEAPGGKTVVIPEGQRFDLDAMQSIVSRVRQGLPLKGGV